MNNLKDIEKVINKCTLCDEKVEKFTNETSIHYGINNKIVLLGEAPANNGWRKSGLVWHDLNKKMLPSGIVLNKLLEPLNINLMDITFLEAVKCFPKNRSSLNTCYKSCQSILHQQLELLNPDIIITLGVFPTKALLNIEFNKYGDIVGNIYTIELVNKTIKVLPIYHPSPVSPLSYKGNVEIFKTLEKALKKL